MRFSLTVIGEKNDIPNYDSREDGVLTSTSPLVRLTDPGPVLLIVGPVLVKLYNICMLQVN